jgi:hypothetical protein
VCTRLNPIAARLAQSQPGAPVVVRVFFMDVTASLHLV